MATVMMTLKVMHKRKIHIGEITFAEAIQDVIVLRAMAISASGFHRGLV